MQRRLALVRFVEPHPGLDQSSDFFRIVAHHGMYKRRSMTRSLAVACPSLPSGENFRDLGKGFSGLPHHLRIGRAKLKEVPGGSISLVAYQRQLSKGFRNF